MERHRRLPSNTKVPEKEQTLAQIVEPEDTPSSLSSDSSPPLQTNSRHPLSISEPSLRFPRPWGNRHLANWISSSDPDIMRLIVTPADDDNGLSGSSFELISAMNDNDWAREDLDQDAISESISSLDAQRTDDVRSIASTESEDDHQEEQQQNADDEESDHHDFVQVTPSSSEEGLAHPKSELEEKYVQEIDATTNKSLDYVERSLDTPSLKTPEGNEIHQSPSDEASDPEIPTLVAKIRQYLAGHGDSVAEDFCALIKDLEGALSKTKKINTFSMLTEFITMFLIFLIIPIAFMSAYQFRSATPVSSPAVITTTAIMTATATTTTTTTETIILGTNVPTGLNNGYLSTDWFFSSKVPEVSFEFTPSLKSITVQAPDLLMNHWQSNQCLEIETVQNGGLYPARVHSSPEGVRIDFGSEGHGVVELSFKSTCKPKIDKVVKVNLGKKGNLVSGFFRKVHDSIKIGELPGFANGCRLWYRQVSSQVASNVRAHSDSMQVFLLNVQSASDKCMKKARTLFDMVNECAEKTSPLGAKFWNELRRLNETFSVPRWTKPQFKLPNVYRDQMVWLSKHTHPLSEEALARLNNVRMMMGLARAQVQTELQFSLLNAQIYARTSWLKALGLKKESADYQRKAKFFLADKRAVADKLANKHKWFRQAQRKWRNTRWNQGS